ncbi:MAG TPA: type II toxin-antitoxin system VapB family antitoxin [Candidatus Acidoferrum sp.]|nr:type II toxin-antitoxin system VapB family antitoxin [Candidatus Acidoferrum sp.]
MSLNIKNPEAHKLALLLAEETGETLTAAVTEAIRERLESVRRRSKRDALLAALIALGKRGAQLAPEPHMDHAELLYDERGLPK